MGITATSLCSDTFRFDLDFLDKDELQLACDEADVKLPRDAGSKKRSKRISECVC